MGTLLMVPAGGDSTKTLYKNRHVQFGIYLAEELRGQGYGQEVLGFLQKYVFEDLGLHRLALNVASWNERAQKAYLRAFVLSRCILFVR